MSEDVLILALRVAVVVALYAFLIALLVVIRRDLLVAASTSKEGLGAEGPRDALLVLDSDMAALRSGALFPLNGPTSVGRARDNQVVLDDEFASARHARLMPRDGAWWLTDLGSANGTQLNGNPVGRHLRVDNGDVITIGRTRLKLVKGHRPR